MPDLVQIERVEQNLKYAQKELAFELGQTVLDVVGIVDPTPISDSLSAMMSLYKGDYVGAALSTVSIVPYIGDAIGKPIKAVHNAEKIAQLERKIESLVKQLKELAPERVAKAAENLTEAVAKGRATLIEKIDRGHSLLRHGPDLTDNQLIRRLKEGIAPDGSIGRRVPLGSTRFSSNIDWLQIREKASEQITKRSPYHGGVDLTKPPPLDAKGFSTIKKVERTIEFDRPIGNGFIGKEGTLHKITAKNGKELNVYGAVEKVEELTRVKVTYEWNGKQWEAKQFFPDATDYDPITHQYDTKPDLKTKLPPVVEKEASLDLNEHDTMRTQLNRDQTIAQSFPPNAAQLHVENIAPLSMQQLKELSPRDLLKAVNAVQQWQKSKPVLPAPAHQQAMMENFHSMKNRLAELKTEYQKDKQTYEQIDKRGVRSLLNPFGVSQNEYDCASRDCRVTRESLERTQGHFQEAKSVVQQVKQQQIAYEQWREHPHHQTLAMLSEKLKSPEVQPYVERLQAETRYLQRWEKAAVALGKPDSYVGKIQEIQSGYLEGKGVAPIAIEAMDKDMGQYQQQAQQLKEQGNEVLAL